jgi:hypothetical protein
MVDKPIDNTTATRESLNNSERSSTLLAPVFRLPKAGVIRPGIKALKKSCSADDQKIYYRMLEEGATWDEIDRAIGKDNNGKSKLIPENVDYFTIRPEDCKNQNDAKRLHELYADPDGRIRSLPVWFSVNEWHNLIPHGLRAFGKMQGIRYFSDIIEKQSTDGRKEFVRVCRYPLQVEPGRRIYGGRRYGERQCDPGNCSEYQSGNCSFGGVICCHIPGVRGVGAWLIPTTSWYSLSNIKSTLDIVTNLTRGRIAGLVEPSADSPNLFKTVFRIRKVTETVSMIDIKSGNPTKVEQGLIHLDVDIDLTELAVTYNNQRLITTGFSSAALLNGKTESMTSQASLLNKPSDDVTGISDVDKTTETKEENNTAPANTGKTLTVNAEKLFGILAEKYDTNEQIRAAMERLTKKNSFFDLTDEEAIRAIESLQCPVQKQIKQHANNGSEPDEVKELKNILTALCENPDEIVTRLKELTGVDSFEKVTKEMSKKAIEDMTVTTLNDF